MRHRRKIWILRNEANLPLNTFEDGGARSLIANTMIRDPQGCHPLSALQTLGQTH
jgi:hypothetical protein